MCSFSIAINTWEYLGCGLDLFKLNECVSFSEASLTVKFSSHGDKQEAVVLLWQECVLKVMTKFHFNSLVP